MELGMGSSTCLCERTSTFYSSLSEINSHVKGSCSPYLLLPRAGGRGGERLGERPGDLAGDGDLRGAPG